MKFKAAAVVAFALAGTSAGAATFTFAGLASGPGGNACPPGGLANCVYNDSYAIAKYNFDDGVAGAVETNDIIFPSIDGSEFTISFNSGSTKAGTWSYMPGVGDPTIVTAFAIKGGSGGAAIYQWDPSSGTDFSNISFDMALNGAGNKALSNITFWDTTAPAPVPLPASALLLLAGMGGFAAMRRRKAN